MDLSKPAQHFCAGVLHHMPAICAVTAPSPVSYLRLVPNAWAPTVIDLVRQDRGACLRICPVFAAQSPAETARQFNVEFRACDAAASPYLALGAIIFAGADGIRRRCHCPAPAAAPPPSLPRSLGAGTRPARGQRDCVALVRRRPITTPICASSGSRRKKWPTSREPRTLRPLRRDLLSAADGLIAALARTRRARPGHLTNEAGASVFFLTCDHAGRAIPRRLGQLGLAETGHVASHRLGYRHRRGRAPAVDSARRGADRADLFAAGDRLQSRPVGAELDPGDQRRHRDPWQPRSSRDRPGRRAEKRSSALTTTGSPRHSTSAYRRTAPRCWSPCTASRPSSGPCRGRGMSRVLFNRDRPPRPRHGSNCCAPRVISWSARTSPTGSAI